MEPDIEQRAEAVAKQATRLALRAQLVVLGVGIGGSLGGLLRYLVEWLFVDETHVDLFHTVLFLCGLAIMVLSYYIYLQTNETYCRIKSPILSHLRKQHETAYVVRLLLPFISAGIGGGVILSLLLHWIVFKVILVIFGVIIAIRFRTGRAL